MNVNRSQGVSWFFPTGVAILCLGCCAASSIAHQGSPHPTTKHKRTPQVRPIIRKLNPEKAEFSTVPGQNPNNVQTRVKIIGDHFCRGAIVNWGGNRTVATFISASELEVSLDWTKFKQTKFVTPRQDIPEPAVSKMDLEIIVINPKGPASRPARFHAAVWFMGG